MSKVGSVGWIKQVSDFFQEPMPFHSLLSIILSIAMASPPQASTPGYKMAASAPPITLYHHSMQSKKQREEDKRLYFLCPLLFLRKNIFSTPLPRLPLLSHWPEIDPIPSD